MHRLTDRPAACWGDPLNPVRGWRGVTSQTSGLMCIRPRGSKIHASHASSVPHLIRDLRIGFSRDHIPQVPPPKQRPTPCGGPRGPRQMRPENIRLRVPYNPAHDQWVGWSGPTPTGIHGKIQDFRTSGRQRAFIKTRHGLKHSQP